jgi:hypothetical protein
MTKNNINLLGALIANLNNILLIAIFIARINRYPKTEYWLGLIFILSVFPLVYIFVKSFEFDRTNLYYIQLILMISFIIVELLLDYILKIDFRQNNTLLIPYAILFYASLGGMIGIAGQSGKQWTIITVVTYFIMVYFSWFAHYKTKI